MPSSGLGACEVLKMAKIIVRDAVIDHRSPGSFGTTNYYRNCAILEIECSDADFQMVWEDLKKRGLIPEKI